MVILALGDGPPSHCQRSSHGSLLFWKPHYFSYENEVQRRIMISPGQTRLKNLVFKNGREAVQFERVPEQNAYYYCTSPRNDRLRSSRERIDNPSALKYIASKDFRTFESTKEEIHHLRWKASRFPNPRNTASQTGIAFGLQDLGVWALLLEWEWQHVLSPGHLIHTKTNEDLILKSCIQ